MYNRYIPNGASYTRVVEDDSRGAGRSPPGGHDAPPRGEKKGAGLAGLLKGLKLDALDTGDILLLLVMLFLFLEGDDDMELVITLGLMLLLSL